MAAVIAVGPVKNGDPKGGGPWKICGPKTNMSVSLIKPWVFKVRNRLPWV